MKEALRYMLERVGLTWDNIRAVVCDACAANLSMIATIRIAFPKLRLLTCLAHLAMNIGKAATLPEFEKLLGCLNRALQDPAASKALMEARNQLLPAGHGPVRAPRRFSPTRWFYTFDALKDMIEYQAVRGRAL
jgi:hypothetical protein